MGLHSWRGYNRSYNGPLTEAADEVIDVAEDTSEYEKRRAFGENTVHAAVNMLKISVIVMEWPAETHGEVQACFGLVSMSKGPLTDPTFSINAKGNTCSPPVMLITVGR